MIYWFCRANMLNLKHTKKQFLLFMFNFCCNFIKSENWGKIKAKKVRPRQYLRHGGKLRKRGLEKKAWPTMEEISLKAPLCLSSTTLLMYCYNFNVTCDIMCLFLWKSSKPKMSRTPILVRRCAPWVTGRYIATLIRLMIPINIRP